MRKTLSVAALLFVAGQVHAFDPSDVNQMSPIFSEDFEGQPDFVSGRSERCANGDEPECARVPSGWTHTYTGEKWHPSEFSDAKPSLTIGALPDGTGRGMIISDESWGGPSQWGSGGQLSREMDQGHDDLYAELRVKFEPGFRWHTIENGSGQGIAKVLRLVRYNGPEFGNRFSFFTDGDTGPLALVDTKTITSNRSGRNQGRLSTLVRCAPTATSYKCGDFDGGLDAPLPGEPEWYSSLGDGEWHTVGLRARMNSAPGVADGLLQVWYDGSLVQSRDDVPYVQAGGEMGGFTTLMVGGNIHNYPEPDSARFEQPWYIDDVRLFSLDGAQPAPPSEPDEVEQPEEPVEEPVEEATDSDKLDDMLLYIEVLGEEINDLTSRASDMESRLDALQSQHDGHVHLTTVP